MAWRRTAWVVLGLGLLTAHGAMGSGRSSPSPEAREWTARIFGHDGPARDGLFSWSLDQHPDLRHAFQRLYGPPLPVEPPATGDWKALSDDQRRAVALLYGYDGPIRDGLFARFLMDRPALAEDHRLRYPPGAPPTADGPDPAACPGDIHDPATAERAATAFGHDQPLHGGSSDADLARDLNAQPDLRRAFQRLYGPQPPIEPPPAGDWKTLSDGQRRAVALLYGYDEPIRDGLFARFLMERPALEADHRRRYLPALAAAFPEPSAAPFRPPRRRLDWSALPSDARARIACAFGFDGNYNGPYGPALFAWHLDQMPDLRRAFQRLYGPQPLIEPPTAGDWNGFSDTRRRAVALLYGYDGPVRDGLFARFLKDRQDLTEDHRRRYLPDAPLPPPPPPTFIGGWSSLDAGRRRQVASTFGYEGPLDRSTERAPTGGFARHLDGVADLRRAFQWLYGPALPATPPVAGDWNTFSDARRRAVASLYGYNGPVRDGLFARFLMERPALSEDHRQRYLPGVPAPLVAAIRPSISAQPAPLPPPAPEAQSPPIQSPVAQSPVAQSPAVTPPSSSPPIPAPRPPRPPVETTPDEKAVSRKVPDKAEPNEKQPDRAPPRQGIHMVAGSFKNPGNADTLARRLTAMGYPAHITDWRDAKGGRWRVVRVGPFTSLAKAKAAAAALAAAGIATTPIQP